MLGFYVSIFYDKLESYYPTDIWNKFRRRIGRIARGGNLNVNHTITRELRKRGRIHGPWISLVWWEASVLGRGIKISRDRVPEPG